MARTRPGPHLPAAIAVAMLLSVLLATPAAAGRGRWGPTVVHGSSAFQCSSYDFDVLGGGTYTRHLWIWHTADPARTRITGWYVFKADNGNRRAYRVRYVARSDGEADPGTWTGFFVISDTIQWNNWYYADPGEAAFSEGGYIDHADPGWRNICTELGYPFVIPPDD